MAGAAFLLVSGLAARICVAIILVTAAAGKLRHGAVFEGVVANYRILPRGLARPAAITLPWAELGIGAALLAPVAGPVPALAAAALLLVFAAAMGVNLARGRSHIDCGCHRSELRQTLQWPLVGRNLALAAWLIQAAAAGWTSDPLLLGAGAATGVMAWLLYLLFNALLALTTLNRSVA